MADILAIFGILLMLGIVFPGMLTAWWLLFPGTVERARQRLERTPWQCFWLGGVLTIILVIPIAVLLTLPSGVTQFLGSSAIVLVLAVSSLGAAGLAAKMGERLAERADAGFSPAGAFVRGAIAFELAAAFPIIGWFVVTPLATVAALGATGFALLRWTPPETEATADDVLSDPVTPLPLAQS